MGARNKVKRYFIGIPVDERAQRSINKSLIAIGKFPADVRWVPENNRHMTLAFLGDVPGPAIEALQCMFDASYRHRQAFRFTFPRLERFPNPEGSIIALTGKPTGPLRDLLQITRDLLAINGIGFDQKKFKPHITLGRISRIKQAGIALERQADIILDVTSVILYQSILTEAGSVYTRLAKTNLSKR